MKIINSVKDLLFRNKNAKQTIFKNIFWLSFSQIASRFIRAAIIIYAARVLGALEYGVFSYALGLAGFFTVFADIGLTQILTKEAAQKPEERSQYFATSLVMKLFLLLGTILLIIFIAPYFSKLEEAKKLIPFIAFLTIFDGIRELSIAFLRAKEKMELEALIIIFMNIMIAVSGFIILTYVISAKALTLSYVASTGLGALTAIIILRKEFLKVFVNFRKKLIRPIIDLALPIALISLLGVFMLNTAYVMLGWWKGAEEIGFYSAAQKIIQVLYTLPTILASSLFPIIARFAAQKKSQEATSIIERSITTTLFLAIPLVVGGLVLAKPIINLLYGSEYMPAVPVFQILLSTLLIYFPSVIISNTVLAYDKQKKVAPFIALGSLVNVGLNALLIPIWSIVGASIATFFAQFAVNIPIWIMMKKVSNFHILRHIKKIILSTVIMGIVGFILNKLGLQVLINIALSAGVYFLSLYILKEKIIRDSSFILKKFAFVFKK